MTGPVTTTLPHHLVELKEIASDLRPSTISWHSGRIKAWADEQHQRELAQRERVGWALELVREALMYRRDPKEAEAFLLEAVEQLESLLDQNLPPIKATKQHTKAEEN